jgi:hypothetical protein
MELIIEVMEPQNLSGSTIEAMELSRGADRINAVVHNERHGMGARACVLVKPIEGSFVTMFPNGCAGASVKGYNDLLVSLSIHGV